MTDKTVYAMLASFRKTLDSETYPETAERIECAADYETGELLWEADAIIDDLTKADAAKPLYPAVAELVRSFYEQQIAAGNADAACTLGALYYTGRIGEQNYRKAMQLYTIAAEGGQRQAAENLGYCYYYGRDGEKDYEKAFHWFALCAFEGWLTSLYKIGDMYRYGLYVEKNEREAYRIYRHCLAGLTDTAQDICGADILLRNADCLYYGIGTEKDLLTALAMYQDAEVLFYKRIQKGESNLRRNYQKCAARQAELRAALDAELPDYSWTE